MPIIQSMKLRRGRPERFIVLLQDGTEIVLTPETVLKFLVAPEKEFSETEFLLLLEEDALRQAKDQALRYLSIRPHSTFELTRKMREKGYRNDTIQSALADLQNVGLVDDDAFARLYLQNEIHLKPVGRGLLRQKLRMRGISREATEELLREYFTIELEIEAAETHAQKFIQRNLNLEPKKLREKLFRFLQGKGFSWDIIAGTERFLPGKDELHP